MRFDLLLTLFALRGPRYGAWFMRALQFCHSCRVPLYLTVMSRCSAGLFVLVNLAPNPALSCGGDLRKKKETR